MTLLIDAHPNSIALDLTGRSYLSHSSISTFQSCPLKWHFRYVLGLPEESTSSSLIFGAAIHRAVEHHFRELLAGNPAPDLDTLLAVYHDEWLERELDRVRFGKDDVDALKDVAERGLLAFQASELAQPQGNIIGVEEELRGQLAEGCPELLARVDLLVDEGDVLTLTDLKTARSRWSQQQVESSAEQLLIYAELAKDLLPEKPLRLQFAVVTKTKQPAVDKASSKSMPNGWPARGE